MKKGCSWGCQIQQYQDCFAVAYGMGRILKFSKAAATFYGVNELNNLFLPISKCTRKMEINDTITLPTNEISLRNIVPRIKFLAPAVPKEFESHIEKLYGEPSAWWAGEIGRFLLNPGTKFIEDALTEIQMKRPVVAIIYRKKDNINFIDHMAKVDEYFDILELTEEIDQRRVYVSSDDVSMIAQISANYSDYQIYSYPRSLKENTNPTFHRKDPKGPAIDAFLVAWCDFIVGKFSNSFTRRAFEFSHWHKTDAFEQIKSLGDFYHESSENSRAQFTVIMDHDANNVREITVNYGDLLGAIDNNDYNGFWKVKNFETGDQGLVPSFKLEKINRYETFFNYSGL